MQGVRSDHVEFGHADGRSGSRVKPAWGYMGLDPEADCPDNNIWYGYGTYAGECMSSQLSIDHLILVVGSTPQAPCLVAASCKTSLD